MSVISGGQIDICYCLDWAGQLLGTLADCGWEVAQRGQQGPLVLHGLSTEGQSGPPCVSAEGPRRDLVPQAPLGLLLCLGCAHHPLATLSPSDSEGTRGSQVATSTTHQSAS